MKKTLVLLGVFLLALVACTPSTPPVGTTPTASPLLGTTTPEPTASDTPAQEATPAPEAQKPPKPTPSVIAPTATAAPTPVSLAQSSPSPSVATPTETPVATLIPTATPTPGPVVPPPAPDLVLQPVSSLQNTPVLVRMGPLPSGTIVRYTLDGTDPTQGNPWPSGGLSVTVSGKLRVWAAQPGGEAAVQEGRYTIGEVWVQPGATGDGNWFSPTGTLEEALAKAAASGIRKLKFTAGQWATKVELSGTWELSGGWAGPEKPGGVTVFTGAKFPGATQKDPAYTLKIAPNAQISLSGLEIRSPSASFGTAVLVGEKSEIAVSRSKLIGGNGLYGYGLRAVGASAVTLTDSFLGGGDGGSSFALSADKSSVKVVRCTFDAGTGDAVSYGMNITLSSLSMVSSVVSGGGANSSYGVGLYSSTGTIRGCTVLGGKGTTAYGFYLSDSEPEITGSLIGSTGKNKSYGVFSNYGRSLPKVLRANAFFGSATGAFSGVDLGTVSASPGPDGAFLNAEEKAFTGQSGNIRAEPILGPAPDYKTSSRSPAVLLSCPEPFTGEGATDRNGRVRGTPAAFGAWAISP